MTPTCCTCPRAVLTQRTAFCPECRAKSRRAFWKQRQQKRRDDADLSPEMIDSLYEKARLIQRPALRWVGKVAA